MDSKTIRKAIYNVCADAQAIPYLNSGGCGVFALRMGRALEQLGVRTSAVVFGGKEDVRRVWPNAYIAHVMIEFQMDGHTWHVDSEGMVPAMKKWGWGHPRYAGSVSLDMLSKEVRYWRRWNRTFNRRMYTPKITNMVAKYFNLENRRALSI